MSFRILRSIELIALFFGLPYIYTLGLIPFPVLVFLWLATLLAYSFLTTHREFRFRDLFNLSVEAKDLRRVLARFSFFAILMTGFVYLVFPNELFSFPREKTGLWLKLILLYPLISVLPQSFIYRVFFVERYSVIFESRLVMLIFGTAAFTYMHLVFQNWVALAVTAVGGFLFLETYLRSKSFLLSAFEHALYGCFAFSVGLGSFLYAGNLSG